ncbi:MAG: SMI1/KNR4 family protein [Planctomycetaceae bacterium]|nr:hypothetical protein [Planctomycetota bacterium]NUO15757.1 SMI1/KNR4 family protein [Planctomycetaceae bacterium]GIK53273.1 MAG: hypothetical protein BroJett014_22460 [Planctomycetota bacterium]
MGTQDLATVLRRILPAEAIAGPQSQGSVDRLESALGVRLPPSYREFIKTVGGISSATTTVSGIFAEDAIGEYAGGAYSDTMTLRAESGLPDNLLVIYPSDGSFAWCLDLAQRDEVGETPVVLYECEQARITKKLFRSFAEFLQDFIRIRGT